MFWEFPEVSLLGTIRVFCSNAESRFGCASFRRLGSVLRLFTSCVWVVLWYRILIKTALFLEQNRNFLKRRGVRSKNVFLSSGGLVALVVTKKLFWELPQISPLEKIRVSCSNAESRFGCASLERYVRYFGSLHPAFEVSCDTEYL